MGIQTAEESDQISIEIKAMYKRLDIPYLEINGDNGGYDLAIKMIKEKLNV